MDVCDKEGEVSPRSRVGRGDVRFGDTVRTVGGLEVSVICVGRTGADSLSVVEGTLIVYSWATRAGGGSLLSLTDQSVTTEVSNSSLIVRETREFKLRNTAKMWCARFARSTKARGRNARFTARNARFV
jgi:hypothetical protein